MKTHMKTPQPGTADAAAQQLRELLGEARGTVKDLTKLLRELRDIRAALPAETDKLMETLLNAHIGEVNTALNETINDVQKLIRGEEQKTREHYQDLLGQDGADIIIKTCAMVMHISDPAVSCEEWAREFYKTYNRHKARGCSCTGCLTVAKSIGDTSQRGQVLVVTDPADAPPGSIIIDGR